jgi:hypothetical protein
LALRPGANSKYAINFAGGGNAILTQTIRNLCNWLASIISVVANVDEAEAGTLIGHRVLL